MFDIKYDAIEDFQKEVDNKDVFELNLRAIQTKDGYYTVDGKKISQPLYSRFTSLKDLSRYEIAMLISEYTFYRKAFWNSTQGSK